MAHLDRNAFYLDPEEANRLADEAEGKQTAYVAPEIVDAEAPDDDEAQPVEDASDDAQAVEDE